MKHTNDENKAGWRISEWAEAVGTSRSRVYLAIGAGTISSVKWGKQRIITTSPRDFLARLSEAA